MPKIFPSPNLDMTTEAGTSKHAAAMIVNRNISVFFDP